VSDQGVMGNTFAAAYILVSKGVMSGSFHLFHLLQQLRSY
jgi:hypothetical protein